MRLFTAILLEDPCKDTLCAMIDRIKPLAQGQFTLRNQLHLTLSFIGETERVQQAAASLQELDTQPFWLSIGGIGRFRRSGGDMLWAGVEQSAPLMAIHHALEQNLAKAGFAMENRPYKPHITLGRRAVITDADFNMLASLWEQQGELCAMRVARVSLMKSERVMGQMVYTEIAFRELESVLTSEE